MIHDLNGLTPDQVACAEMLAEWCGGWHHTPRVKAFGEGVEINHTGDLSTFDGSRLTTLVLLAHRDAIRIEIASSGPRRVKIIAHKRSHDGLRMWERHPDLNELIRKAKTPPYNATQE